MQTQEVLGGEQQRATRVEDLRDFPFHNFSEFQNAHRSKAIVIGVSPRIALHWSSTGKYRSNSQKIQFSILDSVSGIAIFGFAAYCVISGNWLWLFALPFLLITLIFGYPISALVYGPIRTIFFYASIGGFLYSLITENYQLFILTIAILSIWLARHVKYIKAQSAFLKVAAEHEDILCALWNQNAVTVAPPVNEVVKNIIDGALSSSEGELHLARAREYLVGTLERNSFNTERAIEIFEIAVDNAIWAHFKGIPMHRKIFREYKASGQRAVVAQELVQKFIRDTGAQDQRPTRKWFRFLLGA